MRLLWISGRDLGEDLAGTTEISLCRELMRCGLEVTFVSPGQTNEDWLEHIPVSTINFPGLVTLSGARNAGKIIDGMDFSRYDIALIDWRYVYPLRKKIRSLGIPWCIIDRGPPATSGVIGGRIRRELLRNLQKRFWERGWMVAERFASAGLVVSEEHKVIVRGFASEIRLMIVPAGAYENPNFSQKSDPSENLKLAYVGRVDKKRGLSSILQLSDHLENNGIGNTISIAGEGDMEKILQKESDVSGKIEYLGKLDRRGVDEMLAKQHVGIMPMPDIPVWRISSPLKLAEYLSSGLAVIGPRHSGNTLPVDGKWSMFSEGDDWIGESVGKIVMELENGWEGVAESAILASKQVSWERIGNDLFAEIQEIVTSH